MDFGKVDRLTLPNIDFKLPQDDPRTALALRAGASRTNTPAKAPRIGVGAPVWGVKQWLGKVYPAGTEPREFLREYAKQFNSIELNTTHYRMPDEATIAQWREITPEGFKFNVKFLQTISHSYPLDANTPLVKEFCESVMGLGDRLGISFLQLPPSFSTDEIPNLERFLSRLPKEFPISVEVRHPSFFNDHKLDPRYYDVIQKAGAHVVITDVSGRRDVLHTSLTTPKALVRFIGNDLHETDETRIADWVERLRLWLSQGLEQVEFFVHQPDNVLSPELISTFIAKLNAACGTAIADWKKAEPPIKKQLSFF